MGPAKSAMSDDRGEYRLYLARAGREFRSGREDPGKRFRTELFPGGDGGSALKVKVTKKGPNPGKSILRLETLKQR